MREYPPTLMIHCTQDTDVPFEESLTNGRGIQEARCSLYFETDGQGERSFTGGNTAQLEGAYNTMWEFMLKHLEANKWRIA